MQGIESPVTESLGQKRLVAWTAEQRARDKSDAGDYFRTLYDTDTDTDTDTEVEAQNYGQAVKLSVRAQTVTM
ncbi:MAG: hypothetical protein PHO37_05265 [Kiritimatiellae bacterium]|nr:hypothetical protein [Kiritimatiellia bacterium]